MKSAVRYLAAVRRELWLMLAIAVGLYFGVEESGTVLDSHRLARFLSMLSASSIAAFVFYFVDVHIRNEKDSELGLVYAIPILAQILARYHRFFDPIFRRVPSALIVVDTKFIAWSDFEDALIDHYGARQSPQLNADLLKLHTELRTLCDKLILANIVLPNDIQRLVVHIAATMGGGLVGAEVGERTIVGSDDHEMYFDMVEDYRRLYIRLSKYGMAAESTLAKSEDQFEPGHTSNMDWRSLNMARIVANDFDESFRTYTKAYLLRFLLYRKLFRDPVKARRYRPAGK